jgi:hypothetical protein
MVKRTLVEVDFKDGEFLIKELDKANFNVHSALWLYNSEVNNWKFVISSKMVDYGSSKKAYSSINQTLNKMKSEGKNIGISLENVTVISPHHPLIKGLGTAINTGPDTINGIRFSQNTINDSYIDDAYIYRIQ